jgi:glycosyltransferase involved in cell wall biosynthesis
VILANGSSTLHYGVVATRTLHHRPRLAYSSIGEPRYWADTPRKRLTFRVFLAFVDQVFSVSHPTATQLTEQFGISERRIRVLPTGVPDELYAVERDRHEPPLRILYMGSLSPEKNPLAAVEILANLVPDTPAVLRMVGDGPLRNEIETTALAANLGHALELVGSVEDVRPHLAWADVLLLTSRTEGLPAATLEAAATGIPSVAFDVGGVAETVHDGATGRLITSGDVTNAALALATYAGDPDTRLAHGQAARAMAESTFTIDLAIARYDRALRELVTGDHKA